ncbi:MAG: uridine phosphorylase [Nitrospira bacterium SG8_35_4]|nr:MAG: uridine phosphorylase [Nitrospira bacterium SG8_35_4]
MENTGPYNTSDLPVFNNRIYHLDLAPEELAPNIIIVGDPDRVPVIAEEFLGDREVDRSHRGLRTITGTSRETGQRVSVTTSGMGTPSLEIVLNELVALHEIDFSTMTRKEACEPITIIRVGTSGGVQHDTPLGTLIVTDYAVGLDNTGLFYSPAMYDSGCELLEQRTLECINTAAARTSRFKGKMIPYVSRADAEITAALQREADRLGVRYKKGITVSNSGFFANQGRDISRVPLTVPDIDGVLASLDTGIPGLRVENMEMEASFLLHFMGCLGYRAGVLCAVIDNRREDRFAEQYIDYIKDAVLVSLRTLDEVSGRHESGKGAKSGK